MQGPVRVAGATKQALWTSVDVSEFAVMDVILSVYEGTSVAVRVLTSTQAETEDSWTALEAFSSLNGGQSAQKTLSGLLNFVRWEVTSVGAATIYLRGICRVQDYYSDARLLARLAAGTTALTITAGAASTWSTNSGALTINGTNGLNLQGGGTTVASIDGLNTALTLEANKNLSGAAGTGAVSLGSMTGATTLPTGDVTWTGAAGKLWRLTQGAATSGSPIALNVVGGAHSGIANADFNLLKIDGSTNSPQVAGGGGAIATVHEILLQHWQIASAAAQTISDAATVAITGAPTAGTNTTITRPTAVWVKGGISRFDGGVYVTATQGEGANFYKTFNPASTSYATGTTVVATYTPATGYKSIVPAYTILPGNLGATPLYAGIRLTYSDATTKSLENGGNPAVTTTRESASWTSSYANDGLTITKVEFYVRNTGGSYTFDVDAFTFDGEQY